MTTKQNDFVGLIAKIDHSAAVLLYEWLKSDRKPVALDARGVGYSLTASNLRNGWLGVVLQHEWAFSFHPNAVETLRSELQVKISEYGKAQLKYFWPKTSLETMVRECQGETCLSDAAQLFEVSEEILQRWQQGKFDLAEFPALSNAVCNTIAALRHEIESLEKELEEVRS